MSRSTILSRAREFLWREARTVERRLFETRFEGGAAEAVRDAVLGHRNPDGGFGHAMEPDLCGPESQPVHVEAALMTLLEAGVRDAAIAGAACDFLARVADVDGLVPLILSSALGHPHAAHWNAESALLPGWNPTFGLAGALHAHGASHPWLGRATAHLFAQLEVRGLGDAHALLGAMRFLQHVPERERACRAFPRVAEQIEGSEYFVMETPVARYGLTPLHFAQAPDSPCRSIFRDDVIEAHLDDLEHRQQDDGGWPISWEPPSQASVLAWRGRWTLDALLVLRAYGRIG